MKPGAAVLASAGGVLIAGAVAVGLLLGAARPGPGGQRPASAPTSTTPPATVTATVTASPTASPVVAAKSPARKNAAVPKVRQAVLPQTQQQPVGQVATTTQAAPATTTTPPAPAATDPPRAPAQPPLPSLPVPHD